jgi:hypothetical protein
MLPPFSPFRPVSAEDRVNKLSSGILSHRHSLTTFPSGREPYIMLTILEQLPELLPFYP